MRQTNLIEITKISCNIYVLSNLPPADGGMDPGLNDVGEIGEPTGVCVCVCVCVCVWVSEY